MDLTEELYNYANKYKIRLIGEYEKVKKTTPIFYSCYQCGRKTILNCIKNTV